MSISTNSQPDSVTVVQEATDNQKDSKALEKEVAATERADKAKIQKEKRPKTIQELREESKSYTHEFSPPFTYGGNTVEKLTFNWSALTGRDSISIEREIAAATKGRGAENFGREHMALIATRACSARNDNDMRIVSMDFMEALPIVDFEEITAMGRLFFRAWGLL